MTIVDFTSGRWGHRIHGATFQYARAASLMERIKDRLLKRRRYTVLVHTSQPIQAGDYVRYQTLAGPAMALIDDVKWKLDPRDMAELEIVLTQHPRTDGGGRG